MKIKINEHVIDIDKKTTIRDIKQLYKPNADITIYNGAVSNENFVLNDGDQVVLIKKGEVPSTKELEAIMVARHTPGVHEIMKQSCVAIAGLGGLGSAVAIALARIGVGKLILVDYDIIEPSNLNRQQYFIDQLGMTKANAIEENLRRINPYVEIDAYTEKVTPKNINRLFKGADILVEAFDLADQKAMLLQNTKNFVVVAASGLAGYGSGETIKIKKLGKNKYIVGDLETGAAPGCGLMAPRVGIAASMQANLVVQLLLGKYE